jgi:hypothetical protein
MQKIREGIRCLYALNLAEGEGLGTAYEYYTKLKKLERFLNSIERPKTILIAGLPEKYGLSLDFFFLGQILNSEAVVVDDRPSVLDRAQNTLLALKEKKEFDDTRVSFLKVDRIEEFDDSNIRERKFDLALSSEVLQRLDGGRGAFISKLSQLARSIALFAPNQANQSHKRISGLKGVSLRELLKYFQGGEEKISIFEAGYLDMPPFPPGLSRSRESREKAGSRKFEAFLMKGLEVYSRCENITPRFLRRRWSHIIYVMAKSS